jgi:hypothetical protein
MISSVKFIKPGTVPVFARNHMEILVENTATDLFQDLTKTGAVPGFLVRHPHFTPFLIAF